ncbi:MAG: ribonuclease R [Betaproteobacteria bacterium]|nr:ribonuclease R [Betaproteobacteria bacterium]
MILSLLEKVGIPVFEEDLARQLDITESEADSFTRRLNAMEREGQLIKNRKGALCLTEKLDLIKGRVQGHPDGFGFVVPDDGTDDLFLGPKQMHKVLHGDRVMVKEIGVDRKGRREASIVEVIEHVNERIVGRIFAEHGVLFLVAENKRINQDILIEPGFDGGAQPGQVVVGQLVAQPSKHSEPIARVIEVLGNYADPGMEIEIALRKHDLPHEWPDAVLALEKKLPKKVVAKDIAGREDLRALPFVTIDGENAKDFDDAVYCEQRGKGFQLWVAIADVSHYVKDGDAFDREAIERGNSVYFPRRVIPMLPEELSNGLCSLKPEVDRLVMVCEMSISGTGPSAGQIKSYRFYPSVIHSQARLTYTKVWNYLSAEDEQDRAASGVPKPLQPHIDSLYAVFNALLKERLKRGAIDFDSAETEMRFNDEGKIEKIVPIVRNDAHKLIEECMLAANVCTAKFILDHEHPALYRIHEPPNLEKLEVLRTFLKDFALSLPGGEEPEAREYSQLIDKIKARPDGQLLQTVMLRSLMQAVYSPDNCGHFGLAYDAYTHFTSPIRRYPDLLVHRVIKALLKEEAYQPARTWHELGAQCSMTERRADEATRDVMNWLKCFFMKDHVGESFSGTISSVVSFGIFVSLDEVFVEGLVHVSDLGQDYFKFDAKRHVMSGERTGKRYRLGDRVTVRVARVDLETSRIDFMLDEHVVTSGRRTMTLTRAPEPVEEDSAPAPQPAAKSPFKLRDIEKREAKAVSHERKEDKQAKKPRSAGALLSGKKKKR